eukprot:CAMPEP_0174899190 /NCGR_PEP_ID=MMETSP0167-20121228/25948_1 /TAXON_ID=38298 /ORGANISM="Rhodella maculata, Strain CCMP736" /LENGTH=103 /DNA_ID=CAMNT_0016140095 /DNA_START=61 /DNA_END=372 /DNA_ORIENTATION=-
MKFALSVALLLGVASCQSTCPCRTTQSCDFLSNNPAGSTAASFEGQPTCEIAFEKCSGCVCVAEAEAQFTCDVNENVEMWTMFDGGYENACRLERYTVAQCPE